MKIRFMRAAGILSAATVALSLGACSSSSGGGGGGGGGDEFSVQTWSEVAPNTNFATFLDEAAEGEKISITQHTGSMTLSLDDAEDIVDFLFFDGDLPVPEAATIVATADGSDENPAHLELTDTMANDFIFRTASTGDLEMVVLNDGTAETDGFFLAETVDDDPEVGDDFAVVRLTFPGVDTLDFGQLDYMSAVAWVTAVEVADDATEVTGEFGLGHMGLATPVDDIPTTGTADYSGAFVGIFVRPGEGEIGVVAVATGDAVFTADFSPDAMDVTGGVFNIAVAGTNLGGGSDELEDVGDILFADVMIDGNTFSGGVVPGEGEDAFSGFADDSLGTLDGVFYGPDAGDGPAEAGAVLTLYDANPENGAFITGVIGAEQFVDD